MRIPGFLFLSLFILSACTADGTLHHAAGNGLTPLPQEKTVTDPSDSVFLTALKEHLQTYNAPSYSQYEFSRIDLDDDGRRDAIAFLTTPYHYWCSKDGCTILIFKAKNDSFKMLSQITPVQNPVLVSDHSSYGWKDLIVRVPGTTLNHESKDVILHFNGKGYPSRPYLEPPLYTAYSRKGITLFQ